MTLRVRTPRRRISPRTKRRYRAVRDFLRRALGNSSQQDIDIQSSIAVNVTGLKHKINGIEQKLGEVNRHCHDLDCVANSSSRETEVTRHETQKPVNQKRANCNCFCEFDQKNKTEPDTELLYRPGDHNQKLYANNSRGFISHYSNDEDSDNQNSKMVIPSKVKSGTRKDEVKVNKKPSKALNRYNTLSECMHQSLHNKMNIEYDDIVSAYSTCSHHNGTSRADYSFKNEYGSTHHRRKKQRSKNILYPITYDDALNDGRHNKPAKSKRFTSPHWKYGEKYYENHKSKYKNPNLDQDFIADIIRKQYKPVKLFGKKCSKISQFSAPVCRDKEFSVKERIREETDLCSCCINENYNKKYLLNLGGYDMRSICDTRLYSNKRRSRSKYRKHTDIYNDEAIYDVIPVKEKSSPKSRRKFAEEHIFPYEHYKEIPPSPRTHRPRLNLRSQFFKEYDDYFVQVQNPKRCYSPVKSHKKHIRNVESEILTDLYGSNIKEKQDKTKIPEKSAKHFQDVEVETLTSEPPPNFFNIQENVMATPNDNILNKTNESISNVDKTDKALSEIKDILQSFLHEIKKEATTSMTALPRNQNDKKIDPEISPITSPQCAPTLQNCNQQQQQGHCNLLPPYMPHLTNPCYPILPVCPMNCVQNGFVVPSPSFTCATCLNNSPQYHRQDNQNNFTAQHQQQHNNKQDDTKEKNNEIDELIKEIYKFVAPNPAMTRKESPNTKENDREVRLTTRSVGDSVRTSRRDAQVGTPKLKCCSKSCEAIGSRKMSDTYYTNASYSDTVLEKLSLEITGTETDLSSETIIIEKKPSNKLTKVLRSFGLFKKKKENIELSESDRTTESYQKKSPFRQEITNYMVHGQEYKNQPPYPPQNQPYQARPPEPQYGYGEPHGHHRHYYHNKANHMNHIHDIYNPHRVYHDTIYEQERPVPSAPPFPAPHNPSAHYNIHPPQVPFCLKEVEVKSTGTQSEKKMSFFRKFSKKSPLLSSPLTQSQNLSRSKNFSTQTQTPVAMMPKHKSNLFNWKNPGKATKSPFGSWPTKGMDPMKFSFDTSKKLANGDLKMRNAMMNKLFYKRNPFSPRNLIVKTILGKDKSSFGDAMTMYRPRMFL